MSVDLPQFWTYRYSRCFCSISPAVKKGGKRKKSKTNPPKEVVSKKKSGGSKSKSASLSTLRQRMGKSDSGKRGSNENVDSDGESGDDVLPNTSADSPLFASQKRRKISALSSGSEASVDGV